MGFQSGQTLSHYRLVEKIGQGGMGVVWRAEDTILGRIVAIKSIHAEATPDQERRQMFVKEARLASSVSDARIVQVYELGSEAGLDFIVMEFVDGKPLTELISGRALPVAKVASIGEQVARALARAHQKHLLHRDIKPGNILVTPDGDVKVVDFGVASLFQPNLSAMDSMISTLSRGADLRAPQRDGRIAGTLPYMSPEQVRGEPLDGRSDIFSLGTVLYEMMTGHRPFVAPTMAELAAEIQKARSTPMRELRPDVPMELDRIVQKTLAPKPGDRYQTMQDLAVDLKRLGRDLESGSAPSYKELQGGSARSSPSSWALSTKSGLVRWTLAAVVVAMALAASVWTVSSRRTATAAAASAHTILIMPFEVRGQTEGAEYVGRAFAEAIAVNLAQWKNLTVLPVPEAVDMGSTGGPHKVDAAIKLGAGRLLSGSLTRNGQLVHASVSLIDTERNRILWGSQRDDDAGTLPGLAAFFSRSVAAELGTRSMKRYDYYINLTGSSPAMANAPETAEAVGALKRFEIRHALDVTKRLVTEFPNESDALALRLRAVFDAYDRNLPGFGRKVLEGALADLTRVDPDNPMPDCVRCELFTRRDSQASKSIEYASRLLLREDLTPAARGWLLRILAIAKKYVGDTSGGLDDVNEAYKLDPTNHYNAYVLGQIREEMGDLRGAEVAFRQCAALAPQFEGCPWSLAVLLAHEGRWEESVAPAKVLCTLAPKRAEYAMYAYFLLKSGKADEARAAAEKASRVPGQFVDGADDLARFWALTGNRMEALRSLRALVAADSLPSNFLADQDLASLRDDPEFKALAVATHEDKKR